MRRARSRGFASKPDLVSTTLIYPITMTTESGTAGGFALTGNASAPLGQLVLDCQDSSSVSRVAVGVTGGPYAIGRDIRAYNSAGTAYAALNGSGSFACLELPDGTSAQGSKVWGGTGAPSASTVGAATAGDYYFRRADPAPVTLVAASYTTSTAQTTLAVGSGTLSTSNTTEALDGQPAAGDLLVFIIANAETTVTASIGTSGAGGGDTGITAASGDGGLAANDGTRYVRMFSRVVQSGDIDTDEILCTASAHATGSGRRLAAYIFRHAGGFTETGSKHGCLLNDSASDTASGAGPFTADATGATRATVAVACNFAGGSNNTTFYWDSGTSSNKVNDMPGAAGNATFSAKPGLGTNTSGRVGQLTGGSSVQVDTAGATHCMAVGVWQVTAQAAQAVRSFTDGSRLTNSDQLTGLPQGHGILVGDHVITAATDTSYNGTYTVTGVGTGSTLAYTHTAADDASSGSGTVTIPTVYVCTTGGTPGTWSPLL